VFDGPEERMHPLERMRRRQPIAWAERLLGILPYLTLLGVLSLVANVIVSFEEPHAAMLFVAALLLFAAPAGMLVHLVVTSEMTRSEKRCWMTGLMRGNAALFAAYFNRAERRATTERLAASK